MSKQRTEINAVGREVLTEINGESHIPFKGVGKYAPQGRKAAPPLRSCRDYPGDGDKRVESIKVALQKCGIKDGMTISSHHHLRNGDYIPNMIFDAAAELGVKDLRWFPSASFPIHAPIVKHLESGVVHHIEGSMNGPLGRLLLPGKDAGNSYSSLPRRSLPGGAGW
jgi:citrate lyase subunit alpha/citrate CoA-transferase